jgi:hypothetical protein
VGGGELCSPEPVAGGPGPCEGPDGRAWAEASFARRSPSRGGGPCEVPDGRRVGGGELCSRSPSRGGRDPVRVPDGRARAEASFASPEPVAGGPGPCEGPGWPRGGRRRALLAGARSRGGRDPVRVPDGRAWAEASFARRSRRRGGRDACEGPGWPRVGGGELCSRSPSRGAPGPVEGPGSASVGVGEPCSHSGARSAGAGAGRGSRNQRQRRHPRGRPAAGAARARRPRRSAGTGAAGVTVATQGFTVRLRHCLRRGTGASRSRARPAGSSRPRGWRARCSRAAARCTPPGPRRCGRHGSCAQSGGHCTLQPQVPWLLRSQVSVVIEPSGQSLAMGGGPPHSPAVQVAGLHSQISQPAGILLVPVRTASLHTPPGCTPAAGCTGRSGSHWRHA